MPVYKVGRGIAKLAMSVSCGLGAGLCCVYMSVNPIGGKALFLGLGLGLGTSSAILLHSAGLDLTGRGE